MGKTKSSRRQFRKTPLPAASVQRSNASDTGISSDLGSIDEGKRLNACRLIANIFHASNTDSRTLERISSGEILSKLCMRIVDSSTRVQYDALLAIRSISACSKASVFQRLMSSGVFDVLMSSLIDHLANNELPLSTQLLAVVSNIISRDETSCSNLLRFTERLIPVLLVAVKASEINNELNLEVSNFLFVASDNFPAFCRQYFQLQGLPWLQQAAVSISSLEQSQLSLQLSSLAQLSVSLRYVGALLNAAFCDKDCSIAVLESTPLASIVRVLLQLTLQEGPVFASLRETSTLLAMMSRDQQTDVDGDLNKDSRRSDDSSHEQRKVIAESEQYRNAVSKALDVIEVASELLANVVYSMTSWSEMNDEGVAADEGDDGEWEDMVVDNDAEDVPCRESGLSELLAHPACRDLIQTLHDVGFAQSLARTVKALCDVLRSDAPLERSILFEVLDRITCTVSSLLSHQISNQLSSEIIAELASTFAESLNLHLDVIQKLQVSGNLTSGFAVDCANNNNNNEANALRDVVATNWLQSMCEENTVDVAVLAELCSQSTASTAQVLLFLCQNAPSLALRHLNQQNCWIRTTSIALCRGILCNDPATVLPCLHSIGFLAVKDMENEMNPSCGVAQSVVDASIHAVFLNAALRRLDVTCMFLKEVEAQSKGASVNCSTAASAIMHLEAALSALIDLNSSDNLEYLSNFARQSGANKMQVAATALRSSTHVFCKLHVNLLDREQRGRVKEALQNVKNFLAYKEPFLAALKKS